MTETLGSKALDLLDKEPEHTPIEMGEKLAELTSKKLQEVIELHKDYGDVYFIQIVFQQENMHARWLPNVHHLQSIVTSQSPGMRPDRSCFKYNNKTDELTYLWSLPDLASCTFIIENEAELSADEQQLLGFVKQFFYQCLSYAQQTKYSMKNLTI
jgi:hypothetical protein